jgi:dolichol-phosphate mannosyltransferase
MTVSVVLPTYCEASCIRAVLRDLGDALSTRAREIVVVDDSPDDATAEAAIAANVGAQIIRRDGGDGLASAVLRGIEATQYDRIVVMDGDGQHPPAVVPDLADALDAVDVAVGSRHAGGSNRADWGLKRDAMSFGASAIAWAAVPESRVLQDPMSGFFSVRREVVEPVRERLRPRGYKILLEILARCPVDSVAEIPFEFETRDAGESNTDWRENVRYLQHMRRLAVASRRKQRPDRATLQEVTDVRA